MAKSTILFILTVAFTVVSHFVREGNAIDAVLIAAVFYGSGCVCRCIEELQPGGRWRQ